MTTHAILIKNHVAATDVRSYNRSAVAGSAVDIDNGNVFRLDSVSTESNYGEVWVVSAPSLSGSTMNSLWMAGSPDTVVTTVDGSYKYKGLTQDPRNFYNSGSVVFDAFKPQVGDIITVTAPALDSASTNTYALSSDGVYTLEWSGSAPTGRLAFRYLATTYISIGSGAINSQRVTAYKLECIAN